MSAAQLQHPPGGGLDLQAPLGPSKWVKSEPNLPQSVSAPKKIPRSAPRRAPAAPPPVDSPAISPPAQGAARPASPDAAVSPALAPDDALFYESRVADSLGLARDRIRELRVTRLTEAADYFSRDGAIVYTGAGLDRLLALTLPPEKTAAPVPVTASPLPAPAIPPGPPPRVPLIVVKLPPNPKLLVCRLPEAPLGCPTVVVRVPNSRHFMPGMEILCIESPPRTFQYTGRLPRSRGRW